MRIRVERSGGLAGIPISNEIDAKDLPSELIHAVKKIMEDNKASAVSMKSTLKGAADHYAYKISIQDGNNLSKIECNELNIEDDLKSLIKYIEKNSKKKN